MLWAVGKGERSILSLLPFLGRDWLPPVFLMENFPLSGGLSPCFNLHQWSVKVAQQLLTKSPKWFLLLKVGKERRWSQRQQDLNQIGLNEMNLEIFLRAHSQLGQCSYTMFLMSSGTSAWVLPAKLGFASANSLVGLKCAGQVPDLKQTLEQKEKTSTS